MIRSAFCILAATAVAGITLAPGAASAASAAPAAPAAPAALAYSSGSPGGGDPDTTVTFVVTTGALSMAVPVSANLGAGAPGTIISGALGAVTVTDDRALASASWTVTAASTDWTNGLATIPATDANYVPGAITTTGTITATGTNITLANTAAVVVTGTSGVGDNTASWDPTISVAVPASAIGGIYTATLTQSVS